MGSSTSRLLLWKTGDPEDGTVFKEGTWTILGSSFRLTVIVGFLGFGVVVVVVVVLLLLLLLLLEVVDVVVGRIVVAVSLTVPLEVTFGNVVVPLTRWVVVLVVVVVVAVSNTLTVEEGGFSVVVLLLDEVMFTACKGLSILLTAAAFFAVVAFTGCICISCTGAGRGVSTGAWLNTRFLDKCADSGLGCPEAALVRTAPPSV